jgi:hypothetical protein
MSRKCRLWHRQQRCSAVATAAGVDPVVARLGSGFASGMTTVNGTSLCIYAAYDVNRIRVAVKELCAALSTGHLALAKLRG